MSKDCIKRFETKNFRSSCHKRSADYTGTAYIFVCIFNRKTHKSSGFSLPIDALKDVKKLKTHTALLRLIKSNKTPLCPRPPETSPLDEVGGGILIPCPILKAAVYSVCLDDIPPCFHSHPVNGCNQPLNLE